MPAHTLARLCAIYAGLAFGTYWIPLRALAGHGLPGAHASLVFLATPAVLLLPIIAWRAGRLARGGLHFHLAGLTLGVAYAFYASAFLYTEVVRAVLLFYLMPIWGFLLARIFTGDPITAVRWASIVLGFAGISVIFGGETGLPLPRTSGDFMALASGFFWAAGSLMMLVDRKSPTLDFTLLFFLWSAIAAAGVVLFDRQLATIMPDWSVIGSVLPWLLPVCLLLAIPTGFASVYAPRELNPGTLGLLFMLEVVVATITASLLAGEPFGLREVSGVLLIIAAGLLEPISDGLNRPTSTRS